MDEAIERVARYKEALKAVKEFKSLQEIRSSLETLEGAQEELSDLMGAVDSACEEGDALKKVSEEAQRWTNKLDMAEQSVQELSVPLDYADLKKVRLFSRVFGLDFKITEDRAISFVFFNLSDKCPDRHCSITMDIEGEKWTVVCMDPLIQGGVQCLLDQLNDGGELKIFCKQVRQKFKDLVISQTD